MILYFPLAGSHRLVIAADWLDHLDTAMLAMYHENMLHSAFCLTMLPGHVTWPCYLVWNTLRSTFEATVIAV